MIETTNGRIKSALVIIVNFIIIVVIVIVLRLYVNDINDKLYNQNLSDIVNINQASAQIASELSISHENKLNNIKKYISRRNLSTRDILEFIDDINDDPEVSFQVLMPDYSGYIILPEENGKYETVNYNNKDYDKIREIIDDADTKEDSIPFTVEFNNPENGSRSFARYVYVSAFDEGVETNITIMAVFKSSDFVNHINLSGGFDDMSTVLINEDGSYALRNADFKSENFFKYLYVYNNLTLDEKLNIKELVTSSGGGTLKYLNYNEQECVYVYTFVPETNWYCVSCVPVSSFHNSTPDFGYTAGLVFTLALLLCMDVMYLVDLNKRLRVSVLEARAANYAKTDFLSRMSHDIRTPINVINGMTELALYEKNPKLVEEYLGNIKSSGKFLLGLVNDILDMNKVESGRMELHKDVYTYGEFIKYLKTVIRPLCDEKCIEFKIISNREDLVIEADSLRLNQIFFNLLSNAVKFTPENGHITLTANVELVTDDEASIDFEVSDDGIGMSEEFQRDMYSTFSQEERSRKHNSQGTGLGLSIVKKLIELMGGTINVKSALGAGTTFYIHLNMKVLDKVVLPDIQEEVITDISGSHILLCEDHPLNAKIIVKLLGKKDVQVDVAENGKIGVDMFSQSSIGYYNAILIDLRMPIMNGLEATREIRSMFDREDASSISIIALTANAYDSDVESCKEMGMNDHMAKPVDPQKLYEILARYINK